MIYLTRRSVTSAAPGPEQSIKSGALTGSAAADARTSLLASYAMLAAGCACAAGTSSAALTAAQEAVDRDYPA